MRGFEVSQMFEYENRYALYPTRKKNGAEIKQVVWIFKEPSVIGIAVVKDLNLEMQEQNASIGMLVGGLRFTPAAKKSARGLRVELIQGNYASFDLFEHHLVPRHRIADEDEIDMLLDYYGITRSELPRIIREDPAVKVLGARPGQIVRIERESPVAGMTYYYRLVVDGAR